MFFAKSILVCATLIAATVVQARIAFTILPNTMQAGQPITLHWGGGDGSPVTITLQQGTTENLSTVLLVTGAAKGLSYTWTVPRDLPNADNYAFRIQQANTEPNYTGLIALTGGASGSITNAASALAAATASKGSSSKSSSGSSSSGSSSAPNSTVTATATAVANSTVTAVGTAAGSAGTGTTMNRNTTMSSATLSSTASSTNSASSVGGSAGPTTTEGGSGSGSGSTASTAPSPSSSNTAGQIASNFALLVCAFAGVAYLG